MTTKRQQTLQKIASFDISNTRKCECKCEECHNEKQILREKIIELHNILEKKITRQSLNASLNVSISNTPKKNRETSAKGCKCKKNCSAKCGCYKKDFACGDNCKCNKKTCQNLPKEDPDKENHQVNKTLEIEPEILAPISPITKRGRKLLAVPNEKIGECALEDQEENFDPMKPRHQLQRSPLPVKQSLGLAKETAEIEPPLRQVFSNISSVEDSNANASTKSVASDLPEELQQPIIDWEKHKAELKQCPKCKRKFIPLRLDKHRAICKGI